MCWQLLESTTMPNVDGADVVETVRLTMPRTAEIPLPGQERQTIIVEPIIFSMAVSPLGEASQFLNTVPLGMQAEAMEMIKAEQLHRHKIEERQVDNENNLARDAQNKRFWLELMGRLFGLVVVLAYFALVAWAFYAGKTALGVVAGLFGAGVLCFLSKLVAMLVSGRDLRENQ